MLPQGYKALYSLAGVEGNWIGASGDVGASTADVVLQLTITGSAKCLVESSADGLEWMDVSGGGYDESTFVVCDHRQQYYRAHVQEYESGYVTAVFGYGRGRENQAISIGRGPGEIEDEDMALGVSRTLAVLLGDSNTIASTASETAFNKSYTLPAGKINQAGAVLRVTAAGKLTSDIHDITLRFRIGGTTFTSCFLTTNNGATNNIWAAQAALTVRTTGSSGTVVGSGVLPTSIETAASPSYPMTYVAPFSKDLASALVVDVTAQHSASGASKSITMTAFVVEALYPAGVIA